MNQVLRRQLNQLTRTAGVYKFFDSTGRLLYVGKAKSLRTRVRSYFQKGGAVPPAKQTMVRDIASLETVKVKNETEALLLEGNLIKQYRPPYNVALKDDKSWLYLAIDYREDFPRLSLERQTGLRDVKYFGPYTSALAARRTFHLLKKFFGVRVCSNPPAKPCFAARLGRCLGHGLSGRSRTVYRQTLKPVEKILRGEIDQIINELTTAMRRAAGDKKFELAAKRRDQINALKQITTKQNIIKPRLTNFDVFGLSRQAGGAAVCQIKIRQGYMLDPENFFLEHTQDLSEREIWENFLPQYYALATNPPALAYLPSGQSGKNLGKIKLRPAKRGYISQLIKLAAANAGNFLEQSRVSWERRRVRAKIGLAILQKKLNLKKPPVRIEGYDISNIQGQEAVGAMVVMEQGLPNPKSYRHFKIQGLNTPNDVAMLAQVIARRFTKNRDWPEPDLVVLDGGAGQLAIAKKVLASHKITVPIIALAKAEELIYLPDKKLPWRLESNDPGLLLLEQLRDEAHRFGITFYRKAHRRRNLESGWHKLPGIGPKLRQRLKKSVGSIDQLKRASLAELAAVVGPARAEKLRENLKRFD